MKKWFVVSLLAVCSLLPSFSWPSMAGIVIQNSTGELITRCVEFEEESISVEELLARSGFRQTVAQTSFGAGICYLHNDGIADPENCFGHPLGWFWNFFEHDGSDWVSSDVGISQAAATDGSLWGFGFGGFGEVFLPPMSFEDVCGFTSHAGLVIDHSDGQRIVLPVEFAGESITALQLLQKSGLELIVSRPPFGTGICSIDLEGQSSEECFDDPLGRYWGFNVLNGNDEWEYSPVGVDEAIVRDGDVHGYFFASFGDVQPPISRNDILEFPETSIPWNVYN